MAIRVNMLRLRRDAATASRARRTASRPTAPPAWRRANCSQLDSVWLDQPDAGRTDARPFPARRPGPSARGRSRTAASCRASSGLGPVSAVGELRLQRHAADRAGAGADLPDLRVHRAGVDRAFRHRRGRLAVGRLEIFRGVGGELGAAAGRAEIIGLALMAVAVRRRRADRPSCRRPDRALAPFTDAW